MNKQYIKNMLIDYILELIKIDSYKKAKYITICLENLIDKIYLQLKDIEILGEYNIYNIKFYEVGNYFNCNSITIFKDNKFFTNIL